MKKIIGFLSGSAVGMGLGIAAGKYMESEEGKKTKENAKKMFADFCKFAEPKIKMAKNLGRAKYKQIIAAAGQEYGKMRKISDEAIEELVEKTFSMWDDFMKTQEA